MDILNLPGDVAREAKTHAVMALRKITVSTPTEVSVPAKLQSTTSGPAVIDIVNLPADDVSRESRAPSVIAMRTSFTSPRVMSMPAQMQSTNPAYRSDSRSPELTAAAGHVSSSVAAAEPCAD